MKKIKAEEKFFDQGYMCAVATLIRLHGESTEVEDLFGANALSLSQMHRREIDPYDMEVLTPLVRRLKREEIQFKN